MEHYYSKEPTSRSDEREIVFTIQGDTMRFITDHGVFSMDRVDRGSEVLLEAVIKAEETLGELCIDIGCGYGPMGITLARRYPQTQFRLIDVNDRAMELSYRNAQKNGVIDRVRVGTAQQILQEEVFADCIVTNPPIRAGKEVIYGLFRKAYEHMKPGARLYVVIRKNQGAASAVRELENIFGTCETIDRSSGYHVLRAVRESESCKVQ